MPCTFKVLVQYISAISTNTLEVFETYSVERLKKIDIDDRYILKCLQIHLQFTLIFLTNTFENGN